MRIKKIYIIYLHKRETFFKKWKKNKMDILKILL